MDDHAKNVMGIFGDYVSDLVNKDIELIKQNMELAKEITRLKELLIKHGIDYSKKEP